jgi:hypothetical protein
MLSTLLRDLHDADVRYVVVGGLSAYMQGTTRVTEDLDLCYATDAPNLGLRRLLGIPADVLLAEADD